MPDIAQWSESEKDLFCKKLEELIHGPNPTLKIGFILVTYPVEDKTRADVRSNCDAQMNTVVLYTILKGLTTKAGGYVG